LAGAWTELPQKLRIFYDDREKEHNSYVPKAGLIEYAVADASPKGLLTKKTGGRWGTVLRFLFVIDFVLLLPAAPGLVLGSRL
jgi:hypothetical protein